MARLCLSVSICRLQQVGGDRHGRCDFSGGGCGGVRRLRLAGHSVETGV